MKATEICAFPGVAVPIVGAPGKVAGLTAAEAVEAGPLPTLLVAYTVQVYGSPLVSPVTMIGLDVPDTVPELEPLELEVQVAV